jgi:hypothetical protein
VPRFAAGVGEGDHDDLQAAHRLCIRIGVTGPVSQMGAVPETSTRRPTRRARLNPMLDSKGEPEATS